MAKTLSKNITFYIGALTMFFVGVFYMLASDLAFNNNAFDLIVAVLLSFGSAILFFLSASFNEKPVIMFVFKGIALALAIGFVIYIHCYQSGFSFGYLADPEKVPNYPSILDTFRKGGASKAGKLAMTQATVIITIVLSYVSIAAQAANTVLVATIKED